MSIKLPVFYFSLLLVHVTSFCFAQYSDLYSQEYLGPNFHAERREALRNKLPEKTLAIFFANPERNRTNDVDYQYRQDSDFLYLTGFLEPNAVLIISNEKIRLLNTESKEFIFVPERNEKAEIWTGKRLGAQGAKSILKISEAFDASSFLDVDFSKLKQVEKIYVRWPRGMENNRMNKADLFDLYQHLKQQSLEFSSVELSKTMAALREVKSPAEIKLLRKAIDITCEAHNQLIKTLNPTMTEIQAQAVLEYYFKLGGSEYPGYPSIVGGAENSCILHYTHNRRKLFPGEMLLFDAGAEFHGYTADVTRTVPVNGKFTEEQKAIYEIVLDAQTKAIEACRPGISFREPHNIAMEIIAKGLQKLGIINKAEDVSKYFMHGTSHYLGLDVHDAGTYGPLKPWSVITVEPGIYIAEGSDCDKKWWNIGVRIEDDILITEDGYENLSAKTPKTIIEIEQLMMQKGILEEINN
ncbi:MAG TPA: aminopeptidase P N-terminal domain-containing protein [Bacteroidia bacterium]|nr:aminopeptidase P N-terminal domain-containing protein [Bacteroidia bacterium]HNT80335.1 aminopeptidase P N-terminal domain-containing protein [Bacteroidia bacterium]